MSDTHQSGCRIVRLAAENVKRLSAVEIRPDGNLVIVGGKNGAGKTSVLDAIMYALAGTKSIPSQPIRTGSKAGSITLELDGDPKLTVTRRLTPAGGSLEIRTADGYKAPSPQKILDELCGRIAFDPLAFTRLKPRDQADALRELVGLDFAHFDERRAQLYDDRKSVNRSAKQAEAAAAEIEIPQGTPAVEVSVADLLARLRSQQKQNAAIDLLAESIASLSQREDALRKGIEHFEHNITLLEQQIESDKSDLAKHQEALAATQKQRKAAAAECAATARIDTAATEEAIAAADAINAAIRKRKERDELLAEATRYQKKSEAITAAIKEIDEEKASQLAAAEWPVTGLGFEEHGITFNGLPFEQASSAEQLRVSVAMGLAVNPTLRVLLVRDGSLLDEDSLRMLAELAAERDGQVWLERIGEGAECSVVVEDGHVKDAPDESAPLRVPESQQATIDEYRRNLATCLSAAEVEKVRQQIDADNRMTDRTKDKVWVLCKQREREISDK